MLALILESCYPRLLLLHLLLLTTPLHLAPSTRDYLPTLVTARLQREEQLKKARSAAKEDSLRRLMKDLEVDRAKHPSANDRWEQEEDDDEGADDELDVNIIDRCMCFVHV